MPHYQYFVTDNQLERAKEWKALADELGLDYEEFRELVYHVTKVYEILDRKKK